MSYSFNKLSKTADCDSLLDVANKEKADLEYKKTSLARRKITYEERYSQLEIDRATLQSEMASLETVLASLPDGDVKDDIISRHTKLEYSKFLLDERSVNYGAIALLGKEMEISLVEKQLVEVDEFIAAINLRKTEIAA